MQVTMPLPQVNTAVMLEGDQEQTLQPQLRLEDIFRENKDLVFRAAYKVTGNANDAEDVLQTVFLRLARQERPKEIIHPRAYLHRAAVNAALDLLRQRKEAVSLSLDDEESGAPQPASRDHGQESAEIQQWLRQALARLNPRWAEMFVLRYIQEYSNGEIAQMMNTSAPVVAVLLHRARTQLKKDFSALTRGRR